jgi:hypothetical protein
MIWEFAAILRDGDQRDEHTILIEADFGNADLFSLQIGKFFERGAYEQNFWPRKEAAARIEFLLRDRHLMGSVPSFDDERLRRLLQSNNRCPSWHYHLHDLEDICLGYLRGQGKEVPDLPINSDEISLMVGVEPPSEAERHTALGDARWVERVWEKVVGF